LSHNDDDVAWVIPVGVATAPGQRMCVGVTWNKTNLSFLAQLTDPQTKRSQHIGSYASEEVAARAYDCAAVQAHGPCDKRNFPGEAISEPPVTVGDDQKQRSSSRHRHLLAQNQVCMASSAD
jgi:hypothetical protein